MNIFNECISTDLLITSIFTYRNMLTRWWLFNVMFWCYVVQIVSHAIVFDCRMDQTSNEYSLYIPRVALSSSGSSSRSTGHFKESALKRLSNNGEISETSGESESEGFYGSSVYSYGGLRPNRNQMYNVHKAPKRGSQSSESSSRSDCVRNFCSIFKKWFINLFL